MALADSSKGTSPGCCRKNVEPASDFINQVQLPRVISVAYNFDFDSIPIPFNKARHEAIEYLTHLPYVAGENCLFRYLDSYWDSHSSIVSVQRATDQRTAFQLQMFICVKDSDAKMAACGTNQPATCSATVRRPPHPPAHLPGSPG